MFEYYLLKMLHGYVLVGHFVIYFWIYLVFEMAFDTYFVFDLICLFWLIVFISCFTVCCVPKCGWPGGGQAEDVWRTSSACGRRTCGGCPPHACGGQAEDRRRTALHKTVRRFPCYISEFQSHNLFLYGKTIAVKLFSAHAPRFQK